MVSLGVVSEGLCDVILEETGIKVKPEDFRYEEGDCLRVFLFDEYFTEIDLDYIEEDDLAYLIFETVDQVGEGVTENRVQFLEKSIGEWLTSQGLTDLVYRIENRGYLSRSRHYTVDVETEKDYPDLVLVVEKGRVFELEVNPYSETGFVDLVSLYEQIRV